VKHDRTKSQIGWFVPLWVAGFTGMLVSGWAIFFVLPTLPLAMVPYVTGRMGFGDALAFLAGTIFTAAGLALVVRLVTGIGN
jgi:hypothetical protein